MLVEELHRAGLKSGVVFISRMLKGSEMLKMIQECRAQDSIRAMSERIEIENNCYVDSKKAAGKSDFDVNNFENVTTKSIPLFNQPDKGVHTDA